MRKFVSDYSLKFIFIENIKKSGSDTNNSMFFISSGSESIGCLIFNNIKTRHGQPRSDREILGNIPEIKVFRSIYRFGLMNFEHNFIREPIRKDVHENRKEQIGKSSGIL